MGQDPSYTWAENKTLQRCDRKTNAEVRWEVIKMEDYWSHLFVTGKCIRLTSWRWKRGKERLKSKTFMIFVKVMNTENNEYFRSFEINLPAHLWVTCWPKSKIFCVYGICFWHQCYLFWNVNISQSSISKWKLENNHPAVISNCLPCKA